MSWALTFFSFLTNGGPSGPFNTICKRKEERKSLLMVLED